MVLNNNSLLIKPLEMTLNNMNGQFRYHNGNLNSDGLKAQWLGQPIDIGFSTREQPQSLISMSDYRASGPWNVCPVSRRRSARRLSGSAAWKSDIAVTLPLKGKPTYSVDVSGDLKNVSSHLPSRWINRADSHSRWR